MREATSHLAGRKELQRVIDSQRLLKIGQEVIMKQERIILGKGTPSLGNKSILLGGLPHQC